MAKTKNKVELSLEEKLEQALVPIDEQPYEVPKNWCWVKNNVVCRLGDGIKCENILLPYLEVKYLRGVKAAEITSKGKMIDIGTKVILVDGENSGEVFDIFEKGYMGSTFKTLVISKSVYDKYLLYFIHSKKDLLRNNKTGSAIPHLNKKLFFDLDFPLPPLEEQKRIVDQIESLFAKLDEAKEKIEDILDNFKIRKISVLHKAFLGQLTKSWRKRKGKSNTEYEREMLQNLTTIIGDGLHGTPCYDEKGEYYFVNGNNFDGKSIKIKPDTKTVNVEEFEKYKKNLSAKNTVFVSINGTLGKTAFYNDEPIILGKSACYLNVLPELNKYYLRYYFETEEFMQYANEKATGSTIKNLGLKAMRELQIPLPSIDEQEEIVCFLDEIFYKEELAKESAEKVLEQIDLMKKSILAKAFRGELGTNNPNEESAVDLLKSILATE